MPSEESICVVSYAVSRLIRDWLERQPQVKEESLTDWLLDRTSFWCPQLRYTPFSRHEEARFTGVDWEWWILARSGALKLRVQAKKLKEAEDNYPGLAYSNAHGLQIEKLMSDAQGANALSMYCFYAAGGLACNAADDCGEDHEPLSIFLADADHVHASFIVPGRQIVTKANILNVSNSLHCLFCCGSFQPRPGDSLDTFASFVRSQDAVADLSFQFDGRRGFHVRVPPTIRSFADLPEPGMRQRWASAHEAEFREVEALAVLDLRGIFPRE